MLLRFYKKKKKYDDTRITTDEERVVAKSIPFGPYSVAPAGKGSVLFGSHRVMADVPREPLDLDHTYLTENRKS